ncbi:hypothetical protein [Empedobacter tilapiae]|uniref:hypothetical protein n=1 Tax=Empedobacter tilapiae TaxID=2491114 RepID=UPI0028D3E410|nr:hypothetical protein [Empedobacter tilapiae]
MEEQFIDILPIKIIYSFESLIQELEHSEYNFGEFNAFLEYLKVTRPELIEGVETFEDFEKLIKNVEPIIEKIIPKPLVKYNLKAITFPFSNKFIFATDRLKELIGEKESRLKFNYENFDYVTLYKICCCFILSKYYHKNLDFNLSNQLVIENKNGYKTYLGTDINHDYFKIFPSDKKFELREDEIEDLLNNYENTELWFKKIPVGSWIAKGFNLVSFFDNTTEIALSNLKSKLLSYGEPFNIVRNDIISALKSIFRINNLEVGFSAYNSNKNQLEVNHLLQLNDSLLVEDSKSLKLIDIACADLQNKIAKSDYYVVSNVESALLKFPEDKMLRVVNNSGIKSLILYPLKNGNSCLGILEIGSKEAGVFNRINANLLREITPLLEESIYRYTVEFENQINAYIQTEYTSLHPSVDWKFREKAREHLLHPGNTKQKSQISFQNVYPIYGELDVRNSSVIRNECLKKDYSSQIDYLILICNELYNRTKKDKFLNYIDDLNDFLYRIDNVDKIYFESELFDYIALHIHPEIPKYVKDNEKSIIEEYLKKLDSTTGLFYVERKKFDQSIVMTNSLLSSELDAFQKDAQEIFPHYYERFKTDGIDYNLFVGRSIAPFKKFSYQNIREIRYWQLQSMITLEQSYKEIQKKTPLKLEIASLLFATNTTLDILFKLDEKRFDVNGYNNAKYEIIKKRLSKAFVKGTNERINQPKKICIVYTEDILREEYTNYINILINNKFLKNDIEFLEIDDLQGISGLFAIRVSVNYRKKLEKYNKLED